MNATAQGQDNRSDNFVKGADVGFLTSQERRGVKFHDKTGKERECLELLKASGIVCLKGNCELYAQHGVDVDPDVEHLRTYYDGVREKLTAEQMEFIREMPLFYEIESNGKKLHFSHFLFLDIEKPYPFLPLSSLKDGSFDKACEGEIVTKYDLAVIGHCHQNFVKGNVVSVSASGLEGASWLLIEVNEDSVDFEHISLC